MIMATWQQSITEEYRWAAQSFVEFEDERKASRKVPPMEATSITIDKPPDHTVDEDGWLKLSQFVRTSRRLKCIKVKGGCILTPAIVSMLFDVKQKYASTIDSIELTAINCTEAKLEPIIQFMKSRSITLHLDLTKYSCSTKSSQDNIIDIVINKLSGTPLRITSLNIMGRRIGDGGLRELMSARHAKYIENLNLAGNGITTEGLKSCLSTKNAKYLVNLNLAQNNITMEGYKSLINFLNQDGVRMKKVELKDNRIILTQSPWDTRPRQRHQLYVLGSMLVESLLNTSSLGYIGLNWFESQHIGREDLLDLKRVLLQKICDMSSMDAICESNHNLHGFGSQFSNAIEEGRYFDARERHLLSINSRDATIGEKIRNKLRAVYFQGDFDTQQFARMDVKLMPYILELATIWDKYRRRNTDTGGWDHVVSIGKIDSIYRLVRNCHIPEMFNFPKPEITVEHHKRENSTLKVNVASLEEKIAVLVAENEKLRARSSNSPNKRSKKSKESQDTT